MINLFFYFTCQPRALTNKNATNVKYNKALACYKIINVAILYTVYNAQLRFGNASSLCKPKALQKAGTASFNTLYNCMKD